MKVDKKLCTPAMLYFVVSVVTILIALFSGVKFIALAMKSVFVIIWTFLLNLLCSKGYKSISWFLVLFPYVVMLLAFFTRSYKEEAFGNVTGNQVVAANVKLIKSLIPTTTTKPPPPPTTTTTTTTTKPPPPTTKPPTQGKSVTQTLDVMGHAAHNVVRKPR